MSRIIPHSSHVRGQMLGGGRGCTCPGRLGVRREKLGSCCLDTVGEDALVSHLYTPHLNHLSPSLIPLIIYSYTSNMDDRAKHTPPPTPSTQPPWMLTPPRSAEKLMRALSIDPVTSDDIPTTTADDDPDYFIYLQQITSPTYRDPPLPSAPSRQ
jgi:hypothetical protein